VVPVVGPEADPPAMTVFQSMTKFSQASPLHMGFLLLPDFSAGPGQKISSTCIHLLSYALDA